MSLHHDFPYEATHLYCKSCKTKTLHNKPMHEFICTKCGRSWDELLLQVNLKQTKYGKLRYECILFSDKIINNSETPSTNFNTLEECAYWLKEKIEKLSNVIN